MGTFDYVHCIYPLPVEGANERTYQTKDTPSQFCDSYEIREDGTLWYRKEDQDWQPEPFTGDIYFYDFADPQLKKGWLEFKGTFCEGRLITLFVESYRRA